MVAKPQNGPHSKSDILIRAYTSPPINCAATSHSQFPEHWSLHVTFTLCGPQMNTGQQWWGMRLASFLCVVFTALLSQQRAPDSLHKCFTSSSPSSLTAPQNNMPGVVCWEIIRDRCLSAHSAGPSTVKLQRTKDEKAMINLLQMQYLSCWLIRHTSMPLRNHNGQWQAVRLMPSRRCDIVHCDISRPLGPVSGTHTHLYCLRHTHTLVLYYANPPTRV